MFEKLRNGIRRSRQNLADRLRSLLRVGVAIDASTLESIEETLLAADVGVEATERIVAKLRTQRQARSGEGFMAALREDMIGVLEPVAQPLVLERRPGRPYVILMAGVNGAGKTTTIAKLARRLRAEGRTVMLAAGDTFRAAAVEQLAEWGARNDVPVVSQAPGADPAAVIYDAIVSAAARGIDVLIADTAGRLHTQSNLMDELRKVRRVITKVDASAPDEVLLVIDGTTGQNALAQAQQFNAAIGVTGLVVTKLDGSAKGGVLVALAERLRIPIRFIGVGEDIDDLLSFDAREFVDALLGTGE